MEVVYLLIGLVIGLVIGGVLGYLLYHGRNSALLEQKSMLERQNEALKAEAEQEEEQLRKDHEQEKEQLREEHEKDLERLEKKYRDMLDEQQKLFEEMMSRVEEKMKNATSSMLNQRQKEWSEASSRNLGDIVTPLRESIKEMREAMDTSTQKQVSMSSEMRTHMEQMIKQSDAARKSTEELTRVFKIGNKVQGNWGETVLNELLESQGLTEGVHYELQGNLQGSNGENLKPDVILHLDKDRDLIIDAKVSMSAYLDYINAEDEVTRANALKNHVDSINRHVKELSRKDYSSHIKPPRSSVGYVIMFVPNSGAMWTALHAQSDLWRNAMEHNVYIADEQSLYAALRIVNLTWRQIKQAQNHQRVFELANKMLERVGQFWSEYEKMGKALTDAQSAYEKCRGKITEGGQSILTTAHQLADLGAKESSKHPLPPSPAQLQ